MPDHVHICIAIPPKHPVASVIGLLKGKSAIAIARTAEGTTDIDVVVLEGNRLYLFECKHSMPPTDPHEMRDVWRDIEKGVRQLQLAAVALHDPGRLEAYLAGWFPGRKRRDNPNVQIAQCVVCSHRVFSGLENDGVPIRDYASLALLTGDGILSMGAVGEDSVALVYGFRLTDENGMSTVDLDDYLSAESKYFKSFEPFMRPMSKVVKLEAATITRETYVYQMDLDDWLRHMEAAIGCKRPGGARRAEESKASTPSGGSVVRDSGVPG